MLDGDLPLGAQDASGRWKLAEVGQMTVWLVQWTPGATTRRASAEAVTVLSGELRVERWTDKSHTQRAVLAGGQASFTQGSKHAITASAPEGSPVFAVHVLPTEVAPVLLLPSELAPRIAEGAKVVDIRSQSERSAQGPLLGAVAVDQELLEHRLDPAGALRLSAAVDTDVEWIIVCGSGDTAPAAVTQLRTRGFRNAKAIAGGFEALRSSGSLDAVLGGVHNHRDAAVMAAH
ncbi:rhodanese-like domain-containing protein [Hoyosella subflava]|uniref:Rhodanese domain-containing protein n=1 Tax=Hoyosella subflava (strain DSM 45089 / JCM 17490 / NBRC 109087 / DQS3-9A1) TaxID=443218 RepID=F6EGW0_HOYSD|nr:rhodanese-like domain-containing protein [Hoyosella subflava]AEF38784.1 hypothetical protein AS9A_0325 [Hoyosella subflava DQS3-9A1]